MRLTTVMWMALALGCSGHKDDHFDALANRINPVVTKLRASASVVLDPTKRSDLNTVTAACLAGIETAKPLGAIEFKDGFVGSERRIGIDDVMYMFAHDPRNYCPDGHRDADCEDWCVQRFNELADAIDRLAGEAAKSNVHIESLRK